VNIVFFGTSHFARRHLAYLIAHQVKVSAVVTRPDRPKGRALKIAPPPVKEYLREEAPEIPLFQPEKASTHECIEVIKNFSPDLFVVVAYGEILKKELLDVPKRGAINVHASLLPKYRGADPIRRCLMNGEKESGVTIIEMAEKMDAGQMIRVGRVVIPETMTFKELEEELCKIACPLLLEVIADIERENIQLIPQSEKEVTLAPKIREEEQQIHWERSAKELHNLIRALSPTPGAWCWIKLEKEIKRMKILRSLVVDEEERGSFGEILLFDPKKGWIVSCERGALKLLELQLEGKKVMSAEELLRGLHSRIIQMVR